MDYVDHQLDKFREMLKQAKDDYIEVKEHPSAYSSSFYELALANHRDMIHYLEGKISTLENLQKDMTVGSYPYLRLLDRFQVFFRRDGSYEEEIIQARTSEKAVEILMWKYGGDIEVLNIVKI